MAEEPVQACWYVYLLRCSDGTLYCGVTNHLKRRVRQHNGELVGGARYTRARRPVRLVWYESQESRSGAGVREAALKRSSRRVKEGLVSAFNLDPTIADPTNADRTDAL